MADEAGPGMPVLGEAADDNGREVAGLGALVDEQEAAAATEVVADEVKQELVEGTEREAAGCWLESGVAESQLYRAGMGTTNSQRRVQRQQPPASRPAVPALPTSGLPMAQ